MKEPCKHTGPIGYKFIQTDLLNQGEFVCELCHEHIKPYQMASYMFQYVPIEPDTPPVPSMMYELYEKGKLSLNVDTRNDDEYWSYFITLPSFLEKIFDVNIGWDVFRETIIYNLVSQYVKMTSLGVKFHVVNMLPSNIGIVTLENTKPNEAIEYTTIECKIPKTYIGKAYHLLPTNGVIMIGIMRTLFAYIENRDSNLMNTIFRRYYNLIGKEGETVDNLVTKVGSTLEKSQDIMGWSTYKNLVFNKEVYDGIQRSC